MHRRAAALFRATVTTVTQADLTRPTPCAGWTLADLLAHQLGQDRAFTAALRGGAQRLADWTPVTVGTDVPAPLLDTLEQQQVALDAFGDPAGLAIWMPEILASAPLPAARALSAHLIDLVVHSWDVGACIGRPPVFDDDLAEFVLLRTRPIPDGAERTAPGAAFARGLPVPDGASPMDETLLRLGRDPRWTPAPRSL